MLDIIGILKEKQNVSSTSTIPEIQFLEKSDLNSALNRRFIELYHTQPKNPNNIFIKISSKRIKRKRIKRPLQRKIREDFYRKKKKKEEENKKREETKKNKKENKMFF